MAYINIADLTFAYEGSSDYVFEQVSFRMDTDWRLGFTGRNGRGKTTFLRLLLDTNNPPAKRTYEYEGTITSSAVFEYFPYPVRDAKRDTWEIAEEILPGVMESSEVWKLYRELSLLEVGEDVLFRAFSTLSHGERTKVRLALLFLKENSFLLIDEPTNHLDVRAREILGQYLKKKSGFILVSHDRRLLDTCVDHILSINKTNIEVQKGNFSSWWENKRRQDEFELAENERLKKDIGRLKAAARQSKDWADNAEAVKLGKKNVEKFGQDRSIDMRAYLGEKSRRMQMRRKNLERRQDRAIDEKSALLKNIEEAEALKLFPLSYRAERLVKFSDVCLFYGAAKEAAICDPVSFEICGGDRIALTGKNGCGKSSVLKALLAQAGDRETGRGTSETEDSLEKTGAFRTAASFTGEIYTGSQLIISYVPQDAGHLTGSLEDYADAHQIDCRLLMMLLRKLDFSREQLEKNMEDYSEGQKKKVLLAASLATKAHLYIWDEPLNYIDVFSRMQIEELILKYSPTLIFVEHDREFTEKIATREIEIRRTPAR